MLKRLDQAPTTERLISSLRGDPVGRNKDLLHLIRIVNEVEGPYSVFLDAAWGDGKTFLVRQLELVLRLSNGNIRNGRSDCESAFWEEHGDKYPIAEPCLPVYFNAWENDDYPDPLLPLLAAIAIDCDSADTKKKVGARTRIAAIIDSISGAAGHCFEASGLERAFSSEDLLASYYARTELRDRLNEFADALLPEVANKLVIIIDELDRCRPAFTIKLLEQIKALFASRNVILVISTDALQLSHAVRGLYGQSFDAEKYLERFYDMRVELSGVESIRYLRYIGFDDQDSYNYTRVANEYIRLLQPTMRDANRLYENLRRGQEYTQSARRDQFRSTMPLFVADGALLPTFIVMAYGNHSLWRKVLRGEDFSGVYDFACRNSEFISVLESLMKWGFDLARDAEPAEEEKRLLIERICALLFIDDRNDQRYLDASNHIGSFMWGRFDVEAYRSLAMHVHTG